MKQIVPFVCILFLLGSCKPQSREFSLIGKWVCIEEYGSDGANQFKLKVKDGDVLTFANDNTVTDKKGNKGTYSLQNNRLHIAIPNNERFYILNRFKDDFKKISLIPVTNEYQIICDEGCAFIYNKIK